MAIPIAADRGRYSLHSFRATSRALAALSERIDDGAGGKSINTLSSPFVSPSVGPGASVDVNLNFGVPGADLFLISELNVVPDQALLSYDVDMFETDGFSDPSFYLAAGITKGLTVFEDFSFGVPDLDKAGTLHIRLTNNDGALSAIFTFGIHAITGIGLI